MMQKKSEKGYSALALGLILVAVVVLVLRVLGMPSLSSLSRQPGPECLAVMEKATRPSEVTGGFTTEDLVLLLDCHDAGAYRLPWGGS